MDYPNSPPRRRPISTGCSGRPRAWAKAPPDGARFTILGCGSSGGVPRLGGIGAIATPTSRSNARRRCSLLVQRETRAASPAC
jgi:hypothetical protein